MSNFNYGMENSNNTPNSNEFNTNFSNYTPPQPEEPRKKPKILWIVLAVIAVLLVGSITAFACVPSISNQVYLTVLSPKNYYLKVEKKAIENMSGTVSSAYGQQVTRFQKMPTTPQTISSNIKFTLDDDYISIFGLSDILPLELKTTNSVDLANKKEKIWQEIWLANESLGSINMLFDLSTENYAPFYIQIPELSEKYLGFEDFEGSISDEDTETVKKAQSFYSNYLSDPTSPQLVKTLISRYSNIVINNVGTVTLEKNAEVSTNGISAKNTKIVAELTAEELKTIYKQIIDTAKNDTDLKNELIRLELCTEEEYNTSLEEAAAEAETMDTSSKDRILMTVWVDKNGNITGHGLTIESENDRPVSLVYHTIKKNNTTNFEYSQASDGVTNLIVKGNNTTKKGVSEGEISAEIGGGSVNYSATVSYDSVTRTNKELGYFSGNFNLSSAQVPSASLKITATGTDTDQKILLETIAFGSNLGSLEITIANSDFEDFTFPSSENVYNINDDEAINRYISSANKDYIEKITNKINGIAGNFPLLDVLGMVGQSGDTFDYDLEEDDDEIIDDGDDGNPTWQTSNRFTINKAPKTQDDLPSDAEVDEDGYYSYMLTAEQVMENGEPSSPGVDAFFSNLIFTDIEDGLDRMLTEEITDAEWETSEPSSYNMVNGKLDDKDSLYTFFLTLSEWNSSANSSYKGFTVKYDTYSKEVFEFTISSDSKDDIYTILKNIIPLTEDGFSKNDFTTVKKKLDKVKKGDNILLDLENSCIYYSVSKNAGYYCTVNANNN